MIAVIHQPNLFPRLKVLQKIALADIWIVLDDVQFAQREYQNRMMVVPNHGCSGPFWCTLPVGLPNGQATRIDCVELKDTDPIQRITKTILSSFQADITFQQDRERLFGSLNLAPASLVELGIISTLELLRIAGFDPLTIRSSNFKVNTSSKTLRLVELCKCLNASSYVSDSGGANYLEGELFDELGIDVLWHVWQAPTGTRSSELGDQIRNSSGLNLLARSHQEFVEAVASCCVSRQRKWSEGR